MNVKTPGDCPECKNLKRLNTLEFLCDCGPDLKTGIWKRHTYLSHQFPVYQAAPELLEALKAMHTCVRQGVDWTAAEWANAMKSAETAIAKAERGAQ